MVKYSEFGASRDVSLYLRCVPIYAVATNFAEFCRYQYNVTASHSIGILGMDYISRNTLISGNCKYFRELTVIVWEYVSIVSNIRGEVLKYPGIRLIYLGISNLDIVNSKIVCISIRECEKYIYIFLKKSKLYTEIINVRFNTGSHNGAPY